MNIGIVGLGLIGGSLARAYHLAGATVYGDDGDQSVVDLAKMERVIAARLDPQTVGACDLVLLALYPGLSLEHLRQLAPHLSPTTLVIDCCGVKEKICAAGFQLARQHGFTFIGGHPMAGTERSGYQNGRADLFQGASMILVPEDPADELLLDRARTLLAPAGFGRLAVTTAAHHDDMIAYTSQLCHLLSSAYVKSPTSRQHRGYSAGSFQDLTRVARLNEDMWTELMMDARRPLLTEVDRLIAHLQEYRDALEREDAPLLRDLLAQGRACKERVDAP